MPGIPRMHGSPDARPGRRLLASSLTKGVIMTTTEHVDTIVIGGDRRASSTGYHLAQRDEKFVILEANARIGDVWRNRFDSYGSTARRSTTACRACRCRCRSGPGPARRTWRATWSPTPPSSTSRSGPASTSTDSRWRATTTWISSGDTLLRATNVVVATGGWQTPVVPDFADQLDVDRPAALQ